MLILNVFQESTGGEETIYHHDQHQSHDFSKMMPPEAIQPPLSNSNPTNLPPELLNMIASLQQGQQPDLMANIQNVLATVMVCLLYHPNWERKVGGGYC